MRRRARQRKGEVLFADGPPGQVQRHDALRAFRRLGPVAQRCSAQCLDFEPLGQRETQLKKTHAGDRHVQVHSHHDAVVVQ